jgi:hypothetical protein
MERLLRFLGWAWRRWGDYNSAVARFDLLAGTAMYMRLAPVTIFVLFALGLPARAQSFDRQDLDCAVAATIEARADKGTTEANSIHKLALFFLNRLVARDDQTNWARVVYDRSQFKRYQGSAEFLAQCTELYRSSLRR